MSKSQSSKQEFSGGKMTEEMQEAFGRIVEAMVDTYSDAPKNDLKILGLALGTSEDELKLRFPSLYKAEIVDDGSDIASLPDQDEDDSIDRKEEKEEDIN